MPMSFASLRRRGGQTQYDEPQRQRFPLLHGRRHRHAAKSLPAWRIAVVAILLFLLQRGAFHLPHKSAPQQNNVKIVNPKQLKFSEVPSNAIIPRTRHNKVIIFGPHDRYNFGDLVFSIVLTRLLTTRAGYDRSDIMQGGLISVNMSRYGGWDDVVGLKQLQEQSRSDVSSGPYDIIYAGGQSTGCNHDCAVNMLPTEELRSQAKKEKIYECGYLIPKELMRNSNSSGATNYAVMNSLGGGFQSLQHQACKRALDTADYISFRDHDPLYPDSACMIRELYGERINEASEAVLKELFGDNIEHKPDYVAVQHKEMENINTRALAAALDRVSWHANNATIVFFAAGTAPRHDTFENYKSIALLMKQPTIVFTVENVWSVVGLISQASAVLSTSLHVRIMAFIYFKPRVTWCTESKHSEFIAQWDAKDSPQCIDINVKQYSKTTWWDFRSRLFGSNPQTTQNQYFETWDVLSRYFGDNPQTTQNATKTVYKKTIAEYLKSFDRFSSLLANGTII